jgi:hypothetical protein
MAFLGQSAWPDLIVGLGIAAMNAGARRAKSGRQLVTALAWKF